MRRIFYRLFKILFLLVFSLILEAGEPGELNISGFVISDFYNIHAAEVKVHANYKPKIMRQVYTDDRSGYQFRRIYLSFDQKIEEDFSFKLRFEMNNNDFSYSKITPEVKDAYLKWQYHDQHFVAFGISGSPAFAVIEDFWGYRKMEKTASDYFEIRSSRDFGISLKGKVLKNINYHFFTGNGESNASEQTGRIDKLHSLSLSQQAEHLIYEVYTDYRLSQNGKYDEFTAQVFTGYKNDYLRWGIQYTYQKNKLMKSAEKGDIQLLSMPAAWCVSQKLTLAFTYSYYIVSEEQDYRQNVLIAGIEYKLRKNISIMPNLLYNDYLFDNAGIKGADIVSRMTMTYNF
ncbi:MAG: hypothetical protein JXQ65_01085 [Candidatus Marinimicrobia bacterium]|nr:hypothetical protein [Candidatus Neomarinimicrobiota bacterium]